MSILIQDSKKLSKKRNKAYLFLINHVQYGIGYASHDEIDKHNILQATRLAIERSIEHLDHKIKNTKKIKKRYIIDGVRWEKMININQDNQVISQRKGDQTYKSIAADTESIIAKVEHDKAIEIIVEQNPDVHEKYDIMNNKGYGTKKTFSRITKTWSI